MIRMRMVAFFAAAVVSVSLPAIVEAQGRREDYARAQKFLNEEIKKLAYDGQIDAHWLHGTSQFWYLKDALDSKEFLIVDAASGSKNPAFDHQRLAAGLSSVAGRRYEAKALPFSYVQFGASAKTVAFAVEQNTFKCDLSSYQCDRTTDVVDEDEEEVRNGPPRQPDPARLPRTERFSPDHKFVAFVREANLWVRNLEAGEQTPS